MKRCSLSILFLSLFINLFQPKHLLVEVADHESGENEDDEWSLEQQEPEIERGGKIQDSIVLLPALIIYIFILKMVKTTCLGNAEAV